MILGQEDEARAWIAALPNVSRETLERLEALAARVVDEAGRQNLISAATVPALWQRHIADSAQLLPLAAEHDGPWLDIGSGAGFPGLVVAAMRDAPVVLVEPRKLRVQFLKDTAAAMGVADRVEVIQAKVEAVQGRDFAIISARAVANLSDLLGACVHLSTKKTRFLLPKGRNATSELEQARRVWQGSFALEPSVTDDEAAIVVIDALRRRDGKAGS